jgi:dipeptidyl aminopeptidase/acylaminoacyl peptidase
MLGVTDKDAGLEGTGGHTGVASWVAAVVDFNGPSNLAALVRSGRATNPVTAFLGASPTEKPELYLKASPTSYVDKGDPPFLFLHGTDDTTVPIEQSKEMMRKLKEVGVKAELYEAPGAAHGFFNRPPHFESALKRMEAFLAEQFR